MDAAAQVPNNRPFWRGRLCFYHPTHAGTGAVARLEFHAATPEREGCFFLEMARQKTAATRGADGRAGATFDWENKSVVKLGFTDVCGLLLVLEGRCDQAGNGRGLFHDTPETNTVITFRRQTEPAGYALEVSRKGKQGNGEAQRTRVLLSDGEALGLRRVFSTALFPMVYGVDSPTPRELHARPPTST